MELQRLEIAEPRLDRGHRRPHHRFALGVSSLAGCMTRASDGSPRSRQIVRGQLHSCRETPITNRRLRSILGGNRLQHRHGICISPLPEHVPPESDGGGEVRVTVAQGHRAGERRTKRLICLREQPEVGLRHPDAHACINRCKSGGRRREPPKLLARDLEHRFRVTRASSIHQQPSEQRRRVSGVQEIVTPIECRQRRPQRALGCGMPAPANQPLCLIQHSYCANVSNRRSIDCARLGNLGDERPPPVAFPGNAHYRPGVPGACAPQCQEREGELPCCLVRLKQHDRSAGNGPSNRTVHVAILHEQRPEWHEPAEADLSGEPNHVVSDSCSIQNPRRRGARTVEPLERSVDRQRCHRGQRRHRRRPRLSEPQGPRLESAIVADETVIDQSRAPVAAHCRARPAP